MLFPLGLLSQGGGAGGAGAFEQIATVNGTGSSGTITFSSIPSTYKHLQLRAVVLTSNNSRNLFVQMNGVTSSSYRAHSLTGLASGILSTDSASTTSMNLGSLDSPLVGASNPSVVITDVLDYANTNKNKTIRSFFGTSSGVVLSSGLFIDTAAVTSLTIFSESTNFAASSRFSLYGIKG
jgi:hypothetical protein